MRYEVTAQRSFSPFLGLRAASIMLRTNVRCYTMLNGVETRVRSARRKLDRTAGSDLRRHLAVEAFALPIHLRLPRSPEGLARAGDQPADRRLRNLRAAPAEQLPPV